MLDVKKLLAKILDNTTYDLLYNGSTTGNVTLSKSVANYKRLVVVYKDNDGTRLTKEIIHNNATTFATCFESVRVTTVTYIKAYLGTFNGKTLTKGFNRQSANSGTPTEGNYIYIERIYGCKSI